ncbi:helix-turn-helix domain-containing protein [Dysgonomonas macrotermitis]|uniref:AraC-type DNA-binding protein n=1 Tax=Dysgonomonas macrotermitis TaxID=1346286 RepID=A0A1M5BTZ2_9BACT|nr:AraC family transcriptional regulator [Dysgonomonas macrotermitis]SHF45692.1 AraC-type DNA-binding protein [Dysgonomonas macrotermitis]
MELLYPQEHLNCYNYEKGDRPAIEPINLFKNETFTIDTIENKVVVVRKGTLDFSFGEYLNRHLTVGQMIILPAGFQLIAKALDDTEFVILRIRTHIELCDRFALEQLLLEKTDKDDFNDIGILESNEVMTEFLDSLIKHIKAGLRCYHFYEIKIKELLFLLRAYYHKKDLLYFFYPLLSNNLSFSNFILQNYHQVRTVKELAELTNYSLSGFEKHFKKVFGVSASQWMKSQRAKIIYHDINNGNKTFKEISFHHGFTSPAHFNDFCKSYFGATPGQIRKRKFSPKEKGSVASSGGR